MVVDRLEVVGRAQPHRGDELFAGGEVGAIGSHRNRYGLDRLLPVRGERGDVRLGRLEVEGPRVQVAHIALGIPQRGVDAKVFAVQELLFQFVECGGLCVVIDVDLVGVGCGALAGGFELLFGSEEVFEPCAVILHAPVAQFRQQLDCVVGGFAVVFAGFALEQLLVLRIAVGFGEPVDLLVLHCAVVVEVVLRLVAACAQVLERALVVVVRVHRLVRRAPGRGDDRADAEEDKEQQHHNAGDDADHHGAGVLARHGRRTGGAGIHGAGPHGVARPAVRSPCGVRRGLVWGAGGERIVCAGMRAWHRADGWRGVDRRVGRVW